MRGNRVSLSISGFPNSVEDFPRKDIPSIRRGPKHVDYNTLRKRTMTTLLLVNPRSGMGDGLRLAQAVREVFRAAGWEVFLVVPPHPQGFTWAARWAVRHGVERVIVLSGDGTFRWAAAGLQHTSIPLGILPGGTGNVLARYLNLPIPGPYRRTSTLQRAAERLLQAQPQAWDLFRVNGALGVLWVGTGLDAAVVLTVEGQRRENGRPLVRTWARFVREALHTLRHWHAADITLQTDAGPADWRAWMLVFANLPLYAGGLIRFPQGSPQDGQLEVWPLVASSWRQVLLQAARALREHGWPLTWPWGGRPLREARLRLPPSWPLYCDGDPLPAAQEVHLQVLPRAIRLLVPPTSTQPSAPRP